MYQIIDPTHDFEFNIQMNIPRQVSTGIFFTKIMNNNNSIYLKTPICSTKQGITKGINGKKMVCDLLISSLETNFIYLFEKLESIIQQKFLDNAEQFLGQSVELSDIEEAFIPPIKSYKSGKFYSIRCILSEPVNIFRENATSIEKIPHITDIKEDVQFIALIEISGVKFSTKTFQFEINIKQIVVLDANPFANCFIRPNSKDQIDSLKIPEIVNESSIENPTSLENLVELPVNPIRDINSIVNEMMDNLSTEVPTLTEFPIDVPTEVLTEFPTLTEDPKDEFAIDINNLEVINLGISENSTDIKLKTNEEFMEIYLKAKEEAKSAKKVAISSYLKLHNIKKMYNLEMEESDDDNFD